MHIKSDINLLPKNNKSKTFLVYLSVILGVLLLTAVFFFAGILLPLHIRSSLSSKIERNKTEISKYEMIEAEFTSLQSKLNDLIEKNNIFPELEKTQRKMTSLFENIQKASPTSIKLTYISTDKKGVHMEGTVSSDREVAQLVVNLRKIKDFSEVIINEIYHQQETNHSKFNVDCFYHQIPPARIEDTR
jgi:Tfp pilus assembly protein PilN